MQPARQPPAPAPAEAGSHGPDEAAAASTRHRSDPAAVRGTPRCCPARPDRAPELPGPPTVPRWALTHPAALVGRHLALIQPRACLGLCDGPVPSFPPAGELLGATSPGHAARWSRRGPARGPLNPASPSRPALLPAFEEHRSLWTCLCPRSGAHRCSSVPSAGLGLGPCAGGPPTGLLIEQCSALPACLGHLATGQPRLPSCPIAAAATGPHVTARLCPHRARPQRRCAAIVQDVSTPGCALLHTRGCCMSGDVLLSHTVPRAVPSALKGLASGFGM